MSSNARASPLAARFNLAMTSECETSRPVVIRDARCRPKPLFTSLSSRPTERIETIDPVPFARSHTRAHAPARHARTHDRDVRVLERLGDADDSRGDRARARDGRETRGTISSSRDAIDDARARG